MPSSLLSLISIVYIGHHLHDPSGRVLLGQPIHLCQLDRVSSAHPASDPDEIHTQRTGKAVQGILYGLPSVRIKRMDVVHTALC